MLKGHDQLSTYPDIQNVAKHLFSMVLTTAIMNFEFNESPKDLSVSSLGSSSTKPGYRHQDRVSI